MIRTLSFGVLLILAATGPWWLAVALFVAYVLKYSGVEAIVVAGLIDSYFMFSGNVIPVYTLGATLLFVCLELLKPYTVFYSSTK